MWLLYYRWVISWEIDKIDLLYDSGFEAVKSHLFTWVRGSCRGTRDLGL